jgi:hypothetical protein
MLCRTLWVSVLLAVGVVGCRKSVDRHLNHTAGSDPGTAAADASTAVDRGDDPCIYLAATEAEAYVGPLETPPFRFDESAGTPSIDGDHCMYRGRGGGEIMVDVLAGGAKMGAAATAGVPRVMGRMLKATGHENQARVPAAISQAGEQGPWDNAQWLSVIGTLETVKGDSGLLINVAVSRAGEQGAYVLAREAMPRLDKPLDYDGAHAAMLAPKPRAPLANPCDLIPRGRVEQAIGPLAGEPERDESGATCTYHVAGANGTQEYPLDITWVNGNKALAMLKGSVAAAAPALGMPAGGALGMPAGRALPPAAQQILSQVSKMTGGVLAAPSLTHGLATDTTLAGPWDAAALVGGTMLAATKHNVMVQLILGSADYDKAKALLAAACERL